MKITLIIVFISTIFVCSETLNLKIPIIGLNINLQFGDFQKKFNKTYSTVEELNRRLLIFTDNVLKFAEHNILYTLGQVTHKVGINQFSDWTQDEFMNYINRGLLKKTRKVRSVRRKPVEQLPVENVNLPSHVDWRDKGVVTNIKDQGLCGSCWAFSATGALETHLKITNGTLVALSEQHLIDCSWDENNEGCSGGLVSYAFDFVKNHGIKSESDYPYIDDDGKCNKQDTTQLVTAISGYVDIPIGSEMDLQITLANVGPVSVAIDGTYELQTYESGILDDKFCTTNDLNHAVLLVGYGTENGIEYYIMKNSWGSYWGEKGYFRMVRNKGNRCGIATMASYPVMTRKYIFQ